MRSGNGGKLDREAAREARPGMPLFRPGRATPPRFGRRPPEPFNYKRLAVLLLVP